MSGLWVRVFRHRGATLGALILSVVVLVAILAPLVFPQDPWQIAGRPLLRPLEQGGVWLGTDMLGRDIAAGIAHGARVSLLIGILATLIACGLGVTVGALAGFYGGLVDDALMRLTELFQTLPSFVVAVVLVALFEPSMRSVVLAIAVVTWPPVARLVRAEFLSLKSREFVQAAIVIGQRDARIILTQILPNAMSPIIVMASMMVATAILLESSLSFLGLGDPNQMSWGYMIGASRAMIRQAWWMSFFPGIAILLCVMALNLVGEGLNDALNPHLARKGQA